MKTIIARKRKDGTTAHPLGESRDGPEWLRTRLRE
jgi:hypothetical protein